MESDLQHHHHHHHHLHQIHHQQPQQQQQQQMNSGLTRYRSAPSSFFSDILDRELCMQFFNRPSSPETERIFARFMNSGDDPLQDSDPPKASILNQNQNQNQSSNNNTGVNYSSPASPAASFYQSNSKPPLPSHSGNESAPYSMGMTAPMFPPVRTGGANNNSSGLIRHSSSPAGLFANINIDTAGFGAMRSMGTYGASNNSSSNEASFSPPSRLKRTSSMGPMSPIAEIDDKSLVGTTNRDNSYVASFSMGSWDDTAMVSDNITGGLKRLKEDDDDDVKQFAASESQNAEGGNRPPMLAHHLSLPKTSAEMAAIEKFFQFQDSVPCKIRAKRGCATHPRSIAERVRRTRISERMRKLQELVPNMEKQTNTSDMLDLAVEYIKDLQKQVQTLSDTRAKCTCSNKQQKQQ